MDAFASSAMPLSCFFVFFWVHLRLQACSMLMVQYMSTYRSLSCSESIYWWTGGASEILAKKALLRLNLIRSPLPATKLNISKTEPMRDACMYQYMCVRARAQKSRKKKVWKRKKDVNEKDKKERKSCSQHDQLLAPLARWLSCLLAECEKERWEYEF